MINEKETKIINDFLDSKNIKSCPLCKSPNQQIFDDYLMLPIVDGESREVRQGKVYPVVALSCTNCSNTLFFETTSILKEQKS